MSMARESLSDCCGLWLGANLFIGAKGLAIRSGEAHCLIPDIAMSRRCCIGDLRSSAAFVLCARDVLAAFQRWRTAGALEMT
jgi:hypothetical protein